MADASQPMFCHSCGYRLDHLESDRCPECGRVFEPADPTSYTLDPRSWPRIGKRCSNIMSCAAIGTVLFGWSNWWRFVLPPGMACDDIRALFDGGYDFVSTLCMLNACIAFVLLLRFAHLRNSAWVW